MFSILYVDDEPGLLEVGKMFLEQGGQFSVETIESAAQALTLLRARHYDAIISDYQMPVMDGIEFLKRVRASGNTIPFIIFTGRGREEVVIQALNEGADFYLQKGGEPLSQFAELAHKIRQAVQQRMAEAIIRDHEQREADIINFLPDATLAIDIHGVVIAWNRAMEKMTGVASSEILGKGDYGYAIPFYHERRPILINLVLKDDPVTAGKYPAISRDGTTLFSEITIPHFNNGKGAALWFTASPLFDTQGEVIGAIESIREITERKQVEEALHESEKRFRELSDLLPQVVYEIDMEGNLKYANHIAFEIFGYTEDEFRQGLNVLQMIAPDDRERALTGIRAIHDGKGRTGRDTAEYQALRKDGTTFPVAIYSSPVVVNDRITGLRGIIVDISERKRAEDTIRESEQKYRTVFETTGTATVMIENNGTISLANSEFERLSGYPKDEIENRKKWTEFVVPEDLDRMLVQHQLRRQDRASALTHYEFRFRTRSGEVRDIYLTIDVIPGTTKSVASLLDITERKRAEGSLIAANQEYTNLLDQIQDVYYRSDAEGRVIKASRSWATLLGYDNLSECLDRSIANDFYVNPADRTPLLNEVYRNGKVTNYEVRLKKKDGTPVLVATSSHLYHDPAGNILGIEGTFRDITERKQQEYILRTQLDLGLALQTVRGLNDTLKTCLNAAIEISGMDSGGVYLVTGSNGSVDLMVSQNLGDEFVKSVSHYPAGSGNARMVMAGKPIYLPFSKTGIVHTPVQEREGLQASAIIPITFGSRVTACLNIASHTLWEIPAAARVALETIAIQIGAAIERIRADDALTESEQRYRNVVEDQTEFISRFLPDGTHVFVNEAYCRYFGLRRDEILGHRFRPQIPAEDQERVRSFFASLTPAHPVDIIVHRIIMPDSKIRWQRWSDRAIFDASGAVTEYQSVGRDITETKETEIALMASEERYRLIADNTADHIWIFDMDLNLKYTSPSVTKMKGFTVAEASSQSLGQMMTPASVECILRRFHEEMALEATGTSDPDRTITFETEEYCKDGSTIMVENAVTLMRDPEGRPVSILGISRDITARKSAEQALRESEDRYRKLVEITPDAILVHQEGRIVYINPAGLVLLGAAHADQVVGKSVLDYIHTESLEKVRTNIGRDLKGKRTPPEEIRMLRLDGETVIVEGQGVLTLYEGKPAIQVAIRDITQRKAVEVQLKESRERFQKIFEDSPLGIAIVSTGFSFRMVNRQFCEMLKYTEDELLTKSFPDITHPDNLTSDITESRKLYTGELKVYKTEKRYIKKDGSILWASLTASPVKDENGRFLYVIALIEDISERKKAEQELVTAYQEYQNLLDQIQDVYYRSDTEGRLTRISRSLTDLLGYRDVSELLGKNIAEEFYLNPGDRTKLLEEITRQGKVTNYEIQLRRKDGTPVTISASSHIWYYPDGTRGGVEGSFRDITEQKRAERIIAETNKKVNLLSSITRHDVANQVTLLKGFAKIAIMKKPDPVVADLLVKIDMAGSAIARQIEFTKEYQELGMHAPGWHRIRDIVERQKTEGISLSCTCDAEIFADRMIEKVFYNLFDNVARHGERVTAITVRCERAPDRRLVITVEDNGAGIPPEDKERIFGKGFGKNTGFGLFLVREILAITGITIHETGVQGAGARFEITVPGEGYRFTS